MAATRTEHDSMGPVEVPADAYYGAQTQRAVRNFPVSGEPIPGELVRALGAVKLACARANRSIGVLDERIADAVERAAAEVADGRLDDHFPVDVFQTGSGTSSNMNANEVIANRAVQMLGGELGSRDPVHPNDHVNAGQSSNDVFPTACHVAALAVCRDVLLPGLRRLADALRAKAAGTDEVVKPGRTHLMDATPVTVGQELAGHARQVELGIERIEATRPRVAELPLGGTAVGTGLNVPEGMTERAVAELRELTGIPELAEARDHFEAQGARDGLVELSGALGVVATSLTKVANDVRWMGSGPRTGLAELRLPEVQPGSSIMPAKVNPVIAESLLQVCMQVIGNHQAVVAGGASGVLELNVAIPVMARNVLESARLLGAGAANFAEQCVEGLEADEARCRDLVERDLAIVTALVPAIGYDASARLAKRSLQEDRPLREVVKAEGLLPDEEVDRILDIKRMTEGGVIS